MAAAVTSYWQKHTSLQDGQQRTDWVYQALIDRKEKGNLSITASTAVRWLRKLGFEWREVRKGVFIDGHEKEDVVDYRTNTFIPRWTELEPRTTEGHLVPLILEPGQHMVIPCTHDECTFHSNDGVHQRWVHKDKKMIRKKSRGQGLMISDFALPCNCLEVPPSFPKSQLPPTLRNCNLQPIPGLTLNPYQATEFTKVGKDS
jgi:hypothetical protein